MWSLVFILLFGPHRSAAYRITVFFIEGVYVRGRVSALAFGPARVPPAAAIILYNNLTPTEDQCCSLEQLPGL